LEETRNNLGLSIGSVHKIVQQIDRNYYISYIRDLNLDIDGIEVVLDSDNINSFILSDENKEWFDTLNHVSLHFDYRMTERIELLWQYDYKYFVFHQNYTWPLQFSIAYNLHSEKIILENIDIKTTIKGGSHHNLLSNYVGYKLNCDISHALSFGFNYLKEFIQLHKNKIKQFHISNYNDECHTCFHNDKNNKLKEIFQIIKENDLTNIPFIIESTFNSESELINEVEYIKNELERINE
jgi:hypothetical protein